MLSDSLRGFFVIWINKDIFIETIERDKVHWNKVYTNLEVFFQQYVAKVLLAIKPLAFCASCEKVLLEENKITKDEARENLFAVINVRAGTTTNVNQLHTLMKKLTGFIITV